MTIAAPPALKTKALANYFGSNRILADRVGEELAGCEHVAVGCVGGGSELVYITARTLLVNDLHPHLMNLYLVASDARLGPKLYRHLRRLPFHPRTLAAAQRRLIARETPAEGQLFADAVFDARKPDLKWAIDYFVSSWMGRGGKAGTKHEFKGELPIRWNAGGGDSTVRYRSATASLIGFRRLTARASFTCLDVFEFIESMHDADGHGGYFDPPWVEKKDDYRHDFTLLQHERLAALLSQFKRTRIVVRYGDHPTVRRLYPPERWRWIERDGRTQANKKLAEVLMVNRTEAA